MLVVTYCFMIPCWKLLNSFDNVSWLHILNGFHKFYWLCGVDLRHGHHGLHGSISFIFSVDSIGSKDTIDVISALAL